VSRDIAIDLDELRRGEFRRAAGISAVAHVALLVVFLYAPQPSATLPRGVVAVELVALPARSGAPAPAAARPKAAPPEARPEPKAEPKPLPPPKPKPKTVVLPAQPTEPKPQPKPTPKPRPAAKPAPTPPPPKPAVAPPPEQDLDDVLAQLREETGDNREAEVIASAPASTGPAGIPTGVQISAEEAAWRKRAKIHLRKNWVLPAGFRTQFLETEVRVDLDPSGAVRGAPTVTRGSGNPWYDEGVVRAIQKSSPLPAPPEAGLWTFVFVPEDSY